MSEPWLDSLVWDADLIFGNKVVFDDLFFVFFQTSLLKKRIRHVVSLKRPYIGYSKMYWVFFSSYVALKWHISDNIRRVVSALALPENELERLWQLLLYKNCWNASTQTGDEVPFYKRFLCKTICKFYNFIIIKAHMLLGFPTNCSDHGWLKLVHTQQ